MHAVRLFIVLIALVVLAGCAGSGVRERSLARLAEVQSVAGEPVESFHFWRLDRWEGLGPAHVAVWTQVNEAWLIEVKEPCQGLEFATVIGLSSSVQRVYSRFDDVRFENQRCRIAEIRPIDVKALRALRRDAAPEA